MKRLAALCLALLRLRGQRQRGGMATRNGATLDEAIAQWGLSRR